MEGGDGKRGVVITKKEKVEKEEGKGQNRGEPKSGDRGKEKSRVQEEGTQEEQKPWQRNPTRETLRRYLKAPKLSMGREERTEPNSQDLMVRRKYLRYEGKNR